MTLTKASITNSVSNMVDLPKVKATKAVETTFEIIKKTLEDGEDVLISGFGKFCVKNKGQRKGRNPTTGEGLMLDARRIVIFKCSSVIKGKLNREA